MQRLILLLLMSTALSPESNPNGGENIIFNRINYIYKLKQVINDSIWKGFTDKQYDLPLIYYTDSACYVANPTGRFISIYKPRLLFKTKRLKVYKTELLDSIPFHMATSMTLGDKTSAYNYKSPFMNCSSLEITRKVVPDVHSTELWATMLLHEYFHGFQFKHSRYFNYFTRQNELVVSEDSLAKIYKKYAWFKEDVDKENELLLSALSATNGKEIQKILNAFLTVRERRRQQAKQELRFDLKSIEQTYEMMEGTARYVEYQLYNQFAKKNSDQNLAKVDSSYHAYQQFKNYTIDRDPWLYQSQKTVYFYATGFNLVRLFDKLQIDYKDRLFREGGLSLEQLLIQAMAKKHGFIASDS